MQATYNVVDDLIRLDAGGVLTDEQYRQAREELGFQYWRGSRLLVGKWTPEREDFVLSLGCDLEHVDEANDAEERAARFEGYAHNAAGRAGEAYAKKQAIQDRIPLGQPILVGHHSEGKARGDIRRIDSYMAASISESEKAAYWARRAAGTLKRAKRRETASAIAKRIKELEADERRQVRYTTPARKLRHKETGVIYVIPEGGSMVEEAVWLRETERARRWLAHIRERLDYERALYAASGGTVADRAAAEGVVPTVGGYILTRGQWRLVEKVNKTTVSNVLIDGPCKGWKFKTPYEEIQGIKSADEYAAMIGAAGL